MNFKKKNSNNIIKEIKNINNGIYDTIELCNLSKLYNDKTIIKDIKYDINILRTLMSNLEYKIFFPKNSDKLNCFIEIKPGVGGLDAQNWVKMLLRQYLRYCERKKFKTKILQIVESDYGGIKYVVLKVIGLYSFGYLNTESGIHRLVRKSPFKSSSNRHTSFASVYIYPQIEKISEFKITLSDLKIETYRSSGAGGQHINKTESAVRIKHISTGIVVQCQNDRSQHRNKNEAIQMLKSRVHEFYLKKRKEIEKIKLKKNKKNISWGNQIRSYVLDINKIKDLRVNFEISNMQKILDGDLDVFIKSNLIKRI